jgi:hypothetical protein
MIREGAATFVQADPLRSGCGRVASHPGAVLQDFDPRRV